MADLGQRMEPWALQKPACHDHIGSPEQARTLLDYHAVQAGPEELQRPHGVRVSRELLARLLVAIGPQDVRRDGFVAVVRADETGCAVGHAPAAHRHGGR